MENFDATVSALRASIINTVKERLGDLLETGSEAAVFIEERASRLAFLMAQRSFEADPVKQATIDSDIRAVRVGIDLAEDSELVDLELKAQETLKTVLDTILGFGKQVLPILIQMGISAIKR